MRAVTQCDRGHCPSGSGGPRATKEGVNQRDARIAMLSAAAIVIHLLLRYLLPLPGADWPLYAAVLLGGAPLLVDLARSLRNGDFGADVLAAISIVTGAVLNEWLVSAIVVLMLAGGRALETFATRRASSVLQALAKRMPVAAHRRDGSRVVDIPLEEIAVGDPIVVLPHEIAPVDGTVTEGHGSMDEAYLTGEPFSVSKAPGSEVFSGALNGEAALTITATRLPVDSRFARIVGVLEAAERDRPRMRRLADRLAAWYTPAALAAAAVSWLASSDPSRFLAVLVVATPCPLLIGIPVAVIGAISLAAKRGIVVRDPSVLERIDTCRTLIFDKTGTLTYGKPTLSEIVSMPGFNEQDVLSAAASVEQYSRHPLAGAVLEAASRAGLALTAAEAVTEKPGQGLRGEVGGKSIRITGRGKVALHGVTLPPPEPGLECLVLIDENLAGLFRFRDEARAETRPFVGHLRPNHGVAKVILLSGDREAEVQYLARSVGIEEVYAGKSPEEKVAIVQQAAREAPTLFVGDGINDAPALMAATVGVALGRNSDITSEAAGAVILDASLAKVDELIHIGRRMRAIALQSALGGMALSMVGMGLAAAGYLPPVGGAVMQECIDLLAVLNALRAALPGRGLTDF